MVIVCSVTRAEKGDIILSPSKGPRWVEVELLKELFRYHLPTFQHTSQH